MILNRKPLLALLPLLAVLGGMVQSASADESHADVPCERLDLTYLNVPTSSLLSDERIRYIEAFLSKKCIQKAKRRSQLGLQLDLMFFDLIYSDMPSSKIYLSHERALDEVSNFKITADKLQNDLPYLTEQAISPSSHDVAATEFVGCIVSRRLDFKTCDERVYRLAKRHAEDADRANRNNVVAIALEIINKKRSETQGLLSNTPLCD